MHWSLQHKKTFVQSPTQVIQKDFDGVAPNIFVGKAGYPHVQVGLLSTPHYQHHDNVPLWVQQRYSIDRIVQLRTSLLNASFVHDAKQPQGYRVDLAQEIAMAHKPVDVEMHVSKQPVYSLQTTKDAIPHAVPVPLQRAFITTNPKIIPYVERMVADADVKAGDALQELHAKHIDEHHLTKLLSAGTLGVKRTLVPTRWSITAVDDTLSKQQLEKIKTYDTHDTAVYIGNYMGNYFLVCCFDRLFSYELFEMYVHDSAYTTDYESHAGRTSYAQQTAGGYYACRLSVVQHLAHIKKQASVLVLRFITDEYHTPLGVWVVRQAVRNAMQQPPIVFSDKELLVKFVKAYAQKKFSYDVCGLLKTSNVLHPKQKMLWEYG
ncbi:MAG: hypothetical protein ACMXYC_04305 [Candidatus Woesearchaeota archaeon]